VTEYFFFLQFFAQFKEFFDVECTLARGGFGYFRIYVNLSFRKGILCVIRELEVRGYAVYYLESRKKY